MMNKLIQSGVYREGRIFLGEDGKYSYAVVGTHSYKDGQFLQRGQDYELTVLENGDVAVKSL